MRLLNKEENPYPEKPKEWFGSDQEASIEHYAKRDGFKEGCEAQHQLDLKGFIKWLEEHKLGWHQDVNGKIISIESVEGVNECWQSLEQLAEGLNEMSSLQR